MNVTKLLVDRNELEKVRDMVKGLLKKGGKYTFGLQTQQLTISGSPYLLDKKEKEVRDYLSRNPNSTKEDVVKGLEGRYSRVTVFRAIERLLKRGIVISRRNTNGRINHLYINHDKEIFSTQENLGAFRYFYSEVMDAMIQIFRSNSLKEKGKAEKALIYSLSRMVELYKFLCNTYVALDILLSHKRQIDEELLHARYELFLNANKEIYTKLNETLNKLEIGHEKGKDIVYAILFNSMWSPSIGELYKMLKHFQKIGLADYFEPMMDAIWALSYPILPSIDSAYESHYRNRTLRDWRNIFKNNSQLRYVPTTTQLWEPEVEEQ